jgi:hypothetical protein
LRGLLLRGLSGYLNLRSSSGWLSPPVCECLPPNVR